METEQTHAHPENIDHGVASLAPPVINSVPQKPVKKPTRQWAAWTRQEEESFFTALRQVGKNFEKITRRVQSKNKDQVRHYYYRLVRRMNKLLGPGLYLDAKNSKDTNAAMLRWWSLLEKYSCKASKLHLKPRRFKIFVEALELQLLKDRKKSVRKRSLGDFCAPSSGTASNQNRVLGQDNRNIKIVLIDSQNIQKIGSGKTTLKRNVSVGVNRGNSKGDSNAMKPVRQRRKPGVVSSAAYKKWEKAAIAGVSLVAEAAEHLERTNSDKEAEQDQDTSGIKKSTNPVEQILRTLPPRIPFAENGVNSSTKLKLQLFPIDDGTRRALELDKHNPHLELTLSNRKKISSVLEHMSRKWGNSNVAAGELMVFPYGAQRENLLGCPRWTQDSVSSAADVFAMIGSPPVFRLRYGWLPTAERAPMASSEGLDGRNPIVERSDEAIMSSANFARTSTDYQTLDHNRNETRTLAATTTVPNKRRHSDAGPNDNNLPESSNHVTNKLRVAGEMDDTRLSNSNGVSAGDWADSLTNISVGDLLLSGLSTDLNDNCPNQPVVGTSHSLQQIAFSCDSFDAAIAAHISRHRDKTGCQSALASDASSSIWDAEETCDGFAFRKKRLQSQSQLEIVSEDTREQVDGTQLVESYNLDEELSDADVATGDFAQEPGNGVDPDNQAKNFGELADIYWPESLGPLDLDIPSHKYHSEDIILSDSLGGLNRLIASSLDAFQNCSFFGLEKKDTTSTVEARESVSFSNFKIGSGM